MRREVLIEAVLKDAAVFERVVAALKAAFTRAWSLGHQNAVKRLLNEVQEIGPEAFTREMEAAMGSERPWGQVLPFAPAPASPARTSKRGQVLQQRIYLAGGTRPDPCLPLLRETLKKSASGRKRKAHAAAETETYQVDRRGSENEVSAKPKRSFGEAKTKFRRRLTSAKPMLRPQ
jgi:hypothetical protein